MSRNTNQEVTATKNCTELAANYNTPKSTSAIANLVLVADELDALYAFETILSNQQYRVKVFTGPKEALKHILEQDNYTYYDLAIIDIRLPDINGIQLYQTLKVINKKIKVLFVSA